MIRKITIALAMSALMICGSLLRADVKPVAMFSDHMVLQSGMSVPIWGTADVGEQVTVSLSGQKQTATAGADGKWMVKLTALKAAADPVEMTIAGKNTITIKDVLVGEVWIGSGQSNMQFNVAQSGPFGGLPNAAEVVAAAKFPQIRIFTARLAMTYEPQTDVTGQWVVCSPETAGAFSAVSYLFARNLHKELNVPVGVLTLAQGASVAEAWISRQTLVADPKLKFMVDALDENVAYYRLNPKPEGAVAPLHPTPINKPRTPARAPATARGTDTTASGTPTTQPGGRGPQAARGRGGAGAVQDPMRDQHFATILYNGMIAPVIPYAIKGVVWYQGESICFGTPGLNLYGYTMQTLVKDWRKHWGQGDFTFLEVQLPGQANISNNPRIREEQQTILSLPHTGMAVTIDTGEQRNVHPVNKEPTCDRLARIALVDAYGRKIEDYGPMYDSMKVEGGSIRIKFTHLGGGLVAKGGELKGFQIAGEDKKLVDAQAKIDGDTLLVSSPDVKSPVAVRYAFVDYPEGLGCNLFNAAGIPAAPFRSDKWDYPIQGIVEN